MISLCERFHCLPSQVLAEPASVLRMVELYNIAHPPKDDDG